MKRALRSIAAAALFCTCLPIPSQAVVPGSKIKVTFEGLTSHGKQIIIPGGYDGLDFDSSFWASGKGVYKNDPGFQAVIHGSIACVLPNGLQDSGLIQPTFGQGPFSIKSGHFAAFGGGVVNVTFNAYRNGWLVGTMFVNGMNPQDNFIKFDKTFSNIDQFQIIGGIAFDDLVVKFSE